MHRLKLQVAHRVCQAGDASSAQVLVELTPGMTDVIAEMFPIHEHVTLIRAQIESHSFFFQLAAAVNVFKPGYCVECSHELRPIARDIERAREITLAKCSASVREFLGIGAGDSNPAVRIRKFVVVDDQRSPAPFSIRIGKNIFIHRA